jgi:PEP-CTERM motif
MTRRFFLSGFAFLLLPIVASTVARTELIVAGQTTFSGAAIQTVELLPGTPINPSGSSIFINNVTAVGSFTIDRQAELGTTIVFTGNNSLFLGSDPLLGPFALGAGPPLGFGGFGGTITNVVQNPGDPGFATGQPSSFASGTLNLTGASFGFSLLAIGESVFTDPAVPFAFTAILDGLPPSTGTLLSNPGADSLNILYHDDASGLNIVVAHSTNRRIIIGVPEPSSLVLVGLGAISLGRFGLRRKTSA